MTSLRTCSSVNGRSERSLSPIRSDGSTYQVHARWRVSSSECRGGSNTVDENTAPRRSVPPEATVGKPKPTVRALELTVTGVSQPPVAFNQHRSAGVGANQKSQGVDSRSIVPGRSTLHRSQCSEDPGFGRHCSNDSYSRIWCTCRISVQTAPAVDSESRKLPANRRSRRTRWLSVLPDSPSIVASRSA